MLEAVWVIVSLFSSGLGSHHADVLAVGVQYAKAMGMRVIAVDGGDDKRKLCLDKLGAEEYIDFTKEKDIPAKVTELTKVWMFREVECAHPPAEPLFT